MNKHIENQNPESHTEHTKIETTIDLLMLAGQLLLEYGAETYRVETSIIRMFRSLGGSGEINAVALGTLLTLDVFENGRHTAVRRIRRRGVNLEKLARVNNIVRKVSEGKAGAGEALSMLRELDSAEIGNKAAQIFAAACFVSGMFVFMTGGIIRESAVAFICCLMVQAGWIFVQKSASLVFVVNIFSGFLTALIALAGASVLNCGLERIIFGALLPLFPGVAMIIAIRDTINGDLTSGVARGVEAALTAVGLALGVSLGIRCAAFFGEFAVTAAEKTAMGLPYAAFAVLVSFGAGLMLNARFKISAAGAVIGGVVYAVFLLCGGTAAGVFVASLFLAALSETAARIFKTPSTLFLIMGVYPLVPGAGIYKTAALILQNNVQEALITGNATAAELLFMAAGIAVVSALFKLKSHNNANHELKK